jgi:hypothetical protein
MKKQSGLAFRQRWLAQKQSAFAFKRRGLGVKQSALVFKQSVLGKRTSAFAQKQSQLGKKASVLMGMDMLLCRAETPVMYGRRRISLSFSAQWGNGAGSRLNTRALDFQMFCPREIIRR